MCAFMKHIFKTVCEKRKIIAREDGDGDALYRRLVDACAEDVCEELDYTPDVVEGQKDTLLLLHSLSLTLHIIE